MKALIVKILFLFFSFYISKGQNIITIKERKEHSQLVAVIKENNYVGINYLRDTKRGKKITLFHGKILKIKEDTVVAFNDYEVKSFAVADIIAMKRYKHRPSDLFSSYKGKEMGNYNENIRSVGGVFLASIIFVQLVNSSGLIGNPLGRDERKISAISIFALTGLFYGIDKIQYPRKLRKYKSTDYIISIDYKDRL